MQWMKGGDRCTNQNETAVALVCGSIAVLGLFRPQVGLPARCVMLESLRGGFALLNIDCSDCGDFVDLDLGHVRLGIGRRLDKSLLGQWEALAFRFWLLGEAFRALGALTTAGPSRHCRSALSD